MTRDEILKLKAVTLYVLNQCGGELDFIHLFKILYFSDRAYLLDFFRFITCRGRMLLLCDSCYRAT